ncbi:MAG: thioredoxin family protein [Sulfurimonas sp.]|nr:thioredoxin family protein [Sulfurimonas sp.]
MMNLKLEKILLLISFFGIFSTINASHVKWKYDFDKSHQEALKQKKYLMVLLIKKDSVSKETLINSFMNQPYIDKINEEFISVLPQ